jgi:hypothetical protein
MIEARQLTKRYGDKTAIEDLAKRHLRPAPLVPTSAPCPLSDLHATLNTGVGRGKRGYELRLAHYTSRGPDAIIASSEARTGRCAARSATIAGTATARGGRACAGASPSCSPASWAAFAARCELPRELPRRGQQQPLRSGAFSMPLTGGWNGSLSGTVSAPAVSVALQGSGTFDEEACDTGPMSVSADRRDPL